MKHLLLFSSALALASVAGCATPSSADDVTTSTATSSLTTDDTDVAPECAGIITYVNTASQTELHSYLPINVVNGIIARRATAPFVNLADLSSVSGIAQARLEDIASRSISIGATSSSCVGIFDELAVSVTDQTAMLNLVNTASDQTLHDTVREDPDGLAQDIINARPFTTLQEIVDIRFLGPATFRAIRDEAVVGPFEAFATAFNINNINATISTNFDWLSVLYQQPGNPSSLVCWGVAQKFLDDVGASDRGVMAGDNEVLDDVENLISYSSEFVTPPDDTAGLADLQRNVANQTFYGCYLRYLVPFGGIDRAFYVNTQTGYRIYTQERWSE